MDNQDVAKVLDEIGDMLDIKGEIPFKVRAYHRAAESVRALAEDINDIRKEERLDRIPAVGSGIAQKIVELLDTGRLKYYEELKESVPPSLLELIEIPGVGPRKAKQLFEELSITTMDELRKAIEVHKLKSLHGMSAKTEENILKGIEQVQKARERILLFEAYSISTSAVEELRKQSFVERADTAGSLRRMKETIGDIDLLTSSKSQDEVMDYFCGLPQVVRVLVKGKTKSSVVVKSGLQMDLRVVDPSEYGSALQYFTGSKEHSIHLRDIAKKKGLKLNEYGVFEAGTGKRLGGRTEEGVYKLLGMDWIPPVLRENKGEIEAAQNHNLPKLVKLDDVKGDLHVHSKWSDGLSTIEEIAQVAKELGYSYVAVGDHAEKLKIASGLTPKEFKKRLKEIEKVNRKYEGLTILSGVELNIDNDGKVDYEDEFLKEFDIVVASIHSGFGQPQEMLTKRTISAMENEYIDIISHPTGRILGKRESFTIDLEKIFDVAAKTGTLLELNSYPSRLDLKDDYIREAKRRGVKIAINTDSHVASHMRYMLYGVATAQRGWLEKEDVVNTYPLEELKKVLK